ncbi:MAG: Gfo/Idh/MocA family oxidoreductase [Verrucomicrobiae bacterium]|nr:Gfo/Idh/MocA family oxidoreductase [Verrucomicrobiae bacterium]
MKPPTHPIGGFVTSIPKMNFSRRSFLKTGVAAAGATLSFPYVKAATGNRPLRIALIGVAGRAKSHYDWMAEEEVVYLCDVDDSKWTEAQDPFGRGKVVSAKDTFPKAKFFKDYRELFDSRDDFDAVVICTPDVHHFPTVMRALRAGKAIYCEKPLTFTAWEAQQIANETARLKLPTQLGNQGMSTIGWRQAHAYYHSGAIGEVLEVHSWMDFDGAEERAARTLPTQEEADTVPDTVDWDIWCGPAPLCNYKQGYFHPGSWRYWTDYGCGRFGDFA